MATNTARNSQSLWYNKPAQFNRKASLGKALPLAGTQLWARLFGGVKKEKILLDSFYSINRSDKKSVSLALEFHSIQGCKDYCRGLDLADAVCTTRFVAGKATHTRSFFIDGCENMLIGEIKADKEKKISFKLKADSKSVGGSYAFSGDVMTVCFTDGGRFYCYAVTAAAKGGKTSHKNNTITVDNADRAYIFVSAQSGDGNKSKELTAKCVQSVKQAVAGGYDLLFKKHCEEYGKIFNSLKFEIEPKKSKYSTDALLKKYPATKDELEGLLFQFGRYLNICSKGNDLSPEIDGQTTQLDEYIKELYPNLMSKNTPFDANKCVFAAGIMRSYLLDFDGKNIIPFPKNEIPWANGYVEGLSVKDKFTADICWADYKIKRIKLTCLCDTVFDIDTLKLGKYNFKATNAAGGFKVNSDTAHFECEKNDEFEFTANIRKE